MRKLGCSWLAVCLLTIVSTAWARGSGWGVPSIIGKNITVNGTLTLDGQADAIQLTVQGNGTQTSSLLVLEQSTGTDVLTVSNAGALSIGVDGTGTSFNFEKAAGLQFAIDARSVVSTVNAATIVFSSATASTVALNIDFANTGDVSNISGLGISSQTAPTALTGDNLSSTITVQPRGQASDGIDTNRIAILGRSPAVESGGNDIFLFGGGAGIGDATNYEYAGFFASGSLSFYGYAATVQTINPSGGADAWIFTHADGLANGAGATWTENTSAGNGTGANGGVTRNVGNAGSGGVGTLLDQCDTGEDLYLATCSSTGATVLTLGSSTTNFSVESDAFDVSDSGAVSGVTTLTASGAIAANGGITFDAATDTVGAHTLSGTLDASTQILTNIGNTGTDFVASTGALTLAGVLTANGGVSVVSGNGTHGATVLGTVTTTDATQTAFSTTFDPGTNVPLELTCRVYGRKDATDSASYLITAGFNDNAGTLSLVGSVTALATHESGGAAAWDATMDASGGTARVLVTGAAATTISWGMRCEAGNL